MVDFSGARLVGSEAEELNRKIEKRKEVVKVTAV
jgi:hypothetical protein